ncbi:MAG: ferritin family protein [Caldisericaceae bacterium]
MSEIENVLLSAMEIELNGIELYRTASEKTEDKQAKEVFDFLSKEETKHFNALKEILLEVKNGKDISVILNGEKPLNKAIFSDDFRRNLAGKNLEFSAISTGLILEKNSIDFYRENKEKAENPKIKDLFAELEKWEMLHYEMLLGEYNDLKQQYWEANNFSPF